MLERLTVCSYNPTPKPTPPTKRVAGSEGGKRLLLQPNTQTNPAHEVSWGVGGVRLRAREEG